MIKTLLLLLTVSFVANAQGPVTTDGWRADLQLIATELPKRHKNLFFKMTQEEFAREVTSIEGRLDKQQSFETEIAIMRLFGKIGDPHTFLSSRTADFSSFPLQVYLFKEGLYITAASEEFKSAVGARVLRIGEVDIKEAISRVRAVTPCGNEQCYLSRLPSFILIPELLYTERITTDWRKASITVEDKDGKQSTLELTATPAGQIVQRRMTAFPYKKTEREHLLPLISQGKTYSFEYVPTSKTLYFAYNHCTEMQSYKFSDFSRDLLAALDSQDVERLVIDLRRNQGGNGGILLPLIPELQKRKINQRGRLFVIIGRGTFSSAADNALELKKGTAAIFVGEPTGQRPNSYGEVKSFRLPNSKLLVGYSTTFWKRVDGDPSAYEPDILAEPSFTSFAAGLDPAITAILNYKSSAPQR